MKGISIGRTTSGQNGKLCMLPFRRRFDKHMVHNRVGRCKEPVILGEGQERWNGVIPILI